MAGASDPLEDMLFSEVDEKAVSDLVGSLESQLAGQSNPPGTNTENRGAGSTATANHHLGKTLPAQVGNTTLEQQQQGQHKAEMHQETNSKEISSEKTVTSPPPSSGPSLDDASTTPGAGVNANTNASGLQSHGTSITTLTASSVSTLASPPSSISTASPASAVSLGAGEPCTDANPPRKRTAATRRGATRVKSLNGGSVTTRRSSNTAVTEISNPVAATSSAANSTRTVTSCINTTTFTLSNASISAGPSAIALDRGTPTIALHRLPNHIVASIAQNGKGTTVSALVQQGARIGPVTTQAAQVNHNKIVPSTGASKSDTSQSKIVMSSQSSNVNSVINTVSSSPSVVTPVTTQQQSTVTTPASISVSVVGQTTTTNTGLVRPTAPSSTPVVAPSVQSQPRPGPAAPQRVVAPQLIVRPPQQQTTIQLPSGFTIPQGSHNVSVITAVLQEIWS